MKTARLLVILAFTLIAGIFAGRWSQVPSAHAQVTTPTLQCNIVGPCSQYLVQVNSARGFGRFQVFQLSEPIDQTQLSNIGAGSTVSIQASEPDPRGAYTFTLSLNEP